MSTREGVESAEGFFFWLLLQREFVCFCELLICVLEDCISTSERAGGTERNRVSHG